MADLNYVRVEWDAEIALVTVDRQDKLNALNAEVVGEIGEVFESLQDDDKVRGVILTGAGNKAFVAGADIQEMVNFTAEEARSFSALGHRVFDLITAVPFPVIAAVDGYALGGGCELMLACDLAYASTRSRFGQPEVNLGVTPGFGGTQRMIRRIGLNRARELIYTGDTIDAEKAAEYHLVLEIFSHEELSAQVMKKAQRIATKAPLAVAQAKRVTETGYDEGLRAANQLEQQAFGLLFGTADMHEGMSAFLEKRKPTFEGR